MSGRMQDRVVVVTGAARGIGFACAERFSEEGARIAILDVLEEEGDKACETLAAQGRECVFVPCDVGIKSAVENAFETVLERFGRVDVLMNNAGLNRPAEFVEMSEADFDLVIRTNLKSVFLCSQVAARDMIARGAGGAIVNMSSTSVIMTMPTIAAYAASKGGISSMTKAMALSLAPHSIRVNAVGPGTIETDLTRERLLANDETRRRILSRTPLGRVGQGREVADVCVFLASDQAAYVTGQTLYIDGGRSGLNYTVPVNE